jgi:hypothetical protein
MKKMVKPHLVLNNGREYWRVCVPQCLQQMEKATRRFFQNKAQAIEFAARCNEAMESISALLRDFPKTDQERVLTCLERLRWNVEALERATDEFLGQAVTGQVGIAEGPPVAARANDKEDPVGSREPRPSAREAAPAQSRRPRSAAVRPSIHPNGAPAQIGL